MEPALQRRLQQLTQESVVHGSPGTILRVHVPAFRAGYAAAAGRFAQDEGRTLRPHDPFRVASVTKTVTAATVLRLAEVGAVALDEAIAEYLEPDLVARVHVIGGRSYADSITLRHLLTHTSGIHDYFDKPFLAEVAAHPDRCWAPRELVEYAVTHGPPSFPPGEGFHYCDTGYVLAGLAVERTTGSPLHEVYRALVLDPLDMDETYLEGHEPPRGSGVSHAYVDDVDVCEWNPTFDWAGGGLVSSAEDLSRLLRGLLGGRLLAEESVRTMTTWVPGASFAPPAVARYRRYGMGLGENVVEHARLVGHTGAWGAFMYHWVDRDVTVTGTVNRFALDRTPLLGGVVRLLAESF
ncbi:MAG TPA: serine hydrolase domain-containing protein [Actinopolymorphaceae bacterium]